MRRLATTLKWTVFALVVGLVLLEGVLRLAGAYLTRKFDASQKSAQQPDCVTILALGESTTGGVWLESSQSYPGQLQRLLTQRYGRPICVRVPMHVGQNTTQMYNRFDRYMSTLQPRLVILMCGANNTWSLEESNIGWFLDVTDPDAVGLRLRLTLDHFRVFKVARMAKYDLDAWRQEAREDLAGTPQYTRWPAPDENIQFGGRKRAAFLELWRYEVGHMIDRARARGAAAILMTYPNYDFPPASDFEALAAAKHVPLVRNDLMLKPLLAPGLADRYFFHDHAHPKAEGYAVIAAELARLIEEQDLLRLRSSR